MTRLTASDHTDRQALCMSSFSYIIKYSWIGEVANTLPWRRSSHDKSCTILSASFATEPALSEAEGVGIVTLHPRARTGGTSSIACPERSRRVPQMFPFITVIPTGAIDPRMRINLWSGGTCFLRGFLSDATQNYTTGLWPIQARLSLEWEERREHGRKGHGFRRASYPLKPSTASFPELDRTSQSLDRW